MPWQDRGFLLGDGLFETVRLYGGRPFRLGAHLARMADGGKRIRLRFNDSHREEVERAVGLWGSKDAAMRITLTRGAGHGLLPPPDAVPNLQVHLRPYPAGEGLDGPLPGALHALLRGRVEERALTAGLKGIGGYLERITALLQAREGGGDEALLLNSRDRVVCGSASNLFWVEGRSLRTPPVGSGILPGVTRGVVMELAAELALELSEDAPQVDELGEADEVFLTSSLRELVPVTRLEGREIGDGAPGPVFLALREAFRRRVLQELDES